MTDTNAPASADANTADTDTTTPGASGEATTFDADYVKKLRDEAAKYRTEAKANAEAAKRLAELEESQKTEAQKLADRAAAAEQDAATAKAEALRYRIATKYGISDEDAQTFLTGTDEDTVTKQAERLAALAKATAPGPGPRPDMSQGARPSKAASGDPATDFATFLGGQLK